METEQKEIFILKPNSVIIPKCCREGWPDCPHVVNRKAKPKKVNKGI